MPNNVSRSCSSVAVTRWASFSYSASARIISRITGKSRSVAGTIRIFGMLYKSTICASIAFMPDTSAAHLNLWKKRLGRVPDSIWAQTELETLVLADNELSEVSEQIGCLKRLRMLDLGHNQLTSVPDALAGLDALTDFLYLHDNQLTSLPESLARLTNLRYLNISENAFDALPECISGMAGLIEL